MNLRRNGFTLVELLVVMGIVAVIFSFSSISVFSTISNNKINEKENLFKTDASSQQLKAMNGETWQGNMTQWGITLSEGKYTLIPQNIDVSMENLILTNDYGNSKILYATGSGEVVGATSSNNTVTIADPKGRRVDLFINKYGKFVQ